MVSIVTPFRLNLLPIEHNGSTKVVLRSNQRETIEVGDDDVGVEGIHGALARRWELTVPFFTHFLKLLYRVGSAVLPHPLEALPELKALRRCMERRGH
jgi:hypothetical protein